MNISIPPGAQLIDDLGRTTVIVDGDTGQVVHLDLAADVVTVRLSDGEEYTTPSAELRAFVPCSNRAVAAV